MGSIIGHRIDYNGVGVLRGQGHMLVKINPSTSNTSTQLLENTCVTLTIRRTKTSLNNSLY